MIPSLQDPIRMHVYEWIIPRIPLGSTVLDIGSRDSGFPAYLASGHKVTACERDSSFRNSQYEWVSRFPDGAKNFSFEDRDMLEITQKFDIITSVFALQHNADNDKDIECYKHCAELLNPGGKIFIAHEFSASGKWIQRGRNDGDLRGYDFKELNERCFSPIMSTIPGDVSIDIRYMTWEGLNASWTSPGTAKTVCIEIQG
jgi:cyclopropane fatty-acyl-phospholipid synthase-like methyltransferase